MKRILLIGLILLSGYIVKGQFYEFDAGYRKPDNNKDYYYKLATLPPSTSSTADFMKVELCGGYWTSDKKYTQEMLFSNRGGFKSILLQEQGYFGTYSGTTIVAYQQTNGSVFIYLLLKNGYYHGAVECVATNYVNPIFNNSPTKEYSPIGTKVFDSGTVVPSFKFDLSNNVGINTRNLDTDSKLTVAGKIKSQEVEVKINAGADFVFEKDYPIPSLEEVEAFVKKNKHLPEIAPAAEMEANGLELGEMNIKLLQKVEELTLYMIEQNKKNKEQSEKLKEQEAKIKALEAENQTLKEMQSAIEDIQKQLEGLKK